MAVIIISSNSLLKAAQIAAETAKALNYRCLGRELLREIGEKYGVSEEKLHKTLDELPSLLGVNARAHALYLAYLEEAVLAKLSQDRVVCHGLAAHLYVRGISHAFKVRVLADPSELIRAMMREKGVSPEKAAKDVKHEEALRSRWSLDYYRVDETAPSLYDLLIDLSRTAPEEARTAPEEARMAPEEARMAPEEAVRIIIETSSHPKFKPMTYSVKSVNDMELASRVRVALLDQFPDVIVQADGSTVVVETTSVPREKGKKAETIERLVRSVPGVGHVEVHVANDIIRQAAESFR